MEQQIIGFLFFIGICLTMWRITELKRLQEESLKTLLQIKHGLVMITAILTRNDTTRSTELNSRLEEEVKENPTD